MVDLKIGFGAWGSSLTLDKKSIKHTNGSADYYFYLKILLSIENIKNVVLLSSSNYSKLTAQERAEFDPKGKIIDATAHIVKPGQMYKKIDVGSFKNRAEAQYHCIHEMKNWVLKNHPDIDLNLIYLSQGAANWCVPNSKFTRHGTPNVALEMGFNYAAPISEYINSSNTPYFVMIPDPRWTGEENMGILYDVFKLPKAILSQCEQTLNWKYIKEYRPDLTTKQMDYITEKINFKYAEIEKVNAFRKHITDPSNERSDEFSIVAMQSSSENSKKDYRYIELKKWVLDVDKEQKFSIYGRWDEQYSKGYSQFKGLVDHTELPKIFENTKYTLVIPLRKKWASYKYLEMLLSGVVPFFHPDYDINCDIISKDHFLRVTSPEDMYKKINFLNKYNEERIKLVKDLQNRLLSEAVSGNFLPRVLNKVCKDSNLNLQFGTVKVDAPKAIGLGKFIKK